MNEKNIEIDNPLYYIGATMPDDVTTEQNLSAVAVHRIDSDTVCVTVQGDVDPNSIRGDVETILDKLLHEGSVRILFDMRNVPFPNASFIAMLVGKTLAFRHAQGDLTLLNLSDLARSHLAMFSPLTFLSIRDGDTSDTHIGLWDAKEMTSPEKKLAEGETASICVEAAVPSLDKVTEFISQLAVHAGMEPLEISKLKIAVYEACLNVIEHGYRFEPDQSLEVKVKRHASKLEVQILDWGQAFDLYTDDPYDVDRAFEEKQKGGYGLFIIKRSVDDIQYSANAINGNQLTLIKELSSGD